MGLGIDTSAHRHAMAKSNKFKKWERKTKKLLTKLEHQRTLDGLRGFYTGDLTHQIEAIERTMQKRKERAARHREWGKEIKQAKLEERKAKYEEG